MPYLVLALVYGIVDGRRGARRAHLRPGVADLDRRRLMWTPGRDPEKFPVCPTCKEIYEKLRDE